MLLLSILIPPLIISLPQTLSKLSHLPSNIKSAVEHFRGTTPTPEYPPSDGPPEYQPEPLEDLQLELQRAPYLPLLMSGKEAWTTLEMDPGNAWGEGNKEHVWFFWFSGVELDLYGEITAPLEGGEWPLIVEDEDREFEWRRRRLEVGMFQGSKNDQVYRDIAIEIGRRQHEEQWEQQQAHSMASSTSANIKSTGVDPILFSSETPVAPPPSYAHFAFVNCHDREELPLCRRFLAIPEHMPMLYVIVRNITVIEPEQEALDSMIPEFVASKNESGLVQQGGDDSVINADLGVGKAISEDPVIKGTAQETGDSIPTSPPQPTVIHKLVLHRVPLKENLTTMDLHNFYEFKRWDKAPAWDSVLNPVDGFVGTAMHGKVGEFLGIGHESWHKTPNWAFGMALALLLQRITVTILDKSHQRRERGKALKREKAMEREPIVVEGDVVENAVPEPSALSEVPEELEVLVETQVPEKVDTVGGGEHAKTQAFEEGEIGMPGNGEVRPGSMEVLNEVNGVVHGESRE